MNDQEKYEYWFAYAKRDLEAAEAMLHAKQWMHVAFFCQQAIEKLVKGLYGLYLDYDSIPRVHNISFVINHFADKLPQPITKGCDPISVVEKLEHGYPSKLIR